MRMAECRNGGTKVQKENSKQVVRFHRKTRVFTFLLHFILTECLLVLLHSGSLVFQVEKSAMA